jgi:hypothetical protein
MCSCLTRLLTHQICARGDPWSSRPSCQTQHSRLHSMIGAVTPRRTVSREKTNFKTFVSKLGWQSKQRRVASISVGTRLVTDNSLIIEDTHMVVCCSVSGVALSRPLGSARGTCSLLVKVTCASLRLLKLFAVNMMSMGPVVAAVLGVNCSGWKQ